MLIKAMPGAPEIYEETIEGLSVLEPASRRFGYEHVTVFQGELDEDDQTRPISLRTVPEELTSRLPDEFLTVARNWRKVATHPNVVEVLRWGDEPSPWVLVDDGFDDTLEPVGSPLALDDACNVVTSVAEALRNAALYNVYHPVLEPGFVRISGDMATIQVDDWGLEHVVATELGPDYITPYTPPEQLDDSFDVTSKQAAVYRLGGIAYYVLTGNPPVSPTEEAIRHEDPILLSGSNDTIPEEIEVLVEQALSKHPDDRPEGPFAFATQFQQALESTRSRGAVSQAGQGVSGTASGTRERSRQREEQTENASGGFSSEAGNRTSFNIQRRKLLAGGALAVILAGVGASQLIDNDSPASPVLDSVPERSEFVTSANPQALLSDSAVEELINEQLSRRVTQRDVALSTFRTRLDGLGLDIESVRRVIAFGAMTVTSPQYFAAILQTEWTAQSVRDGLTQAQPTVTEDEYKGTTVFTIDSNRLPWLVYVCELDDGEFAVGTKPEIEDVIDIYAGQADSISGDANAAFTSAQQAPVRFGFDVPSDVLEQFELDLPISESIEEIEYGFGSVDQNSHSIRVVLRTDSSSAAERLTSQLDFFVSVAQNQLGNTDSIDVSADVSQQLSDVFERMQIETRGSEVIVRITDGTEAISLGLRLLG